MKARILGEAESSARDILDEPEKRRTGSSEAGTAADAGCCGDRGGGGA